MSETFPTRPGVKTNTNRGASNNSRQTPLGEGRGRGSSSKQVQLNRGGARGRGAASFVVTSTRGRAGATSVNTRMQNNNRRMDDSPFLGSGATSSPQGPGRIAGTENNPEGSREGSDNQRGEYVGGFTRFEPNTRRRQQVSEMAQKETQEYERFKQENALKYCNYVGTTGGGEMTEEMARRKQANEVRNQKFNRLQNQQQRREERRELEQREIDLKRSEARKKAEANTSNYRSAKPEDVRRKREDFLRQLEAQSKPPSNPLPTAPVIKREMETVSHDHVYDDRLSNPRPDTKVSPPDDDRKMDIARDFPEEVMTLAAMFPEVDMVYLNELYKDAGSVDAVLDIIGV